MKGLHQITFVEQQQHVLVPGIPLQMVLQVLASRAKGIPGIQNLDSKGVMPIKTLPEMVSEH